MKEKTKIFYEDKTLKLYEGSNLDILPLLPDNSIDSIVTDPPYELGFMGKSWDSTGIAYNVELWKQCLRVLKPGGFLLAFSGSRTYHRMAVAIEDAGFLIKDQMMWLYGSGFPKALDIAKSIDKQLGNELIDDYIQKSGKNSKANFNDTSGEYIVKKATSTKAKQWDGWKTALKPAHEPIVMAQKPLEKGLTYAQNVLKWGVGALNIDESRVGNDLMIGGSAKSAGTVMKTGLKSNYKSEDKIGRFPANVIHDGSNEVKDTFPNTKKGGAIHKDYPINNNIYGDMSMLTSNHTDGFGDSGSAARFFYGAKTQTDDRDQGLDEYDKFQVNDGREKTVDNAYQRGASERKNIHPTVKPTDLMRYLIRMVTPKGGTTMDIFMGSGSTGKGAMVENIINNKNYKVIGIEMTKEYLPIARDRIIKGSKIYAYNELHGKPKKVKVDENQLTLF